VRSPWAPFLLLGAVTAARAGTLEDMDLRRNVEMAIRGSAPTANLHLKVEVVDGVVIPEGIVRDLIQADAVVDGAGSIKGIRAVDRSRLRFEDERPPDDAIAGRIIRKLYDVQSLASPAIRVDVAQGVVTLEGPIPKAAHRGDLRRLCGGIEGVVEVVDKLVSPEAPDAAIQKSLDGVFGRRAEPRFPGSVTAQVDHGAVVLSGRVPRLRDRDLAMRAAWALDGVRMVVDDLRIEAPARVSVVRP
jgi:osmotically-inducible protein OsmY